MADLLRAAERFSHVAWLAPACGERRRPWRLVILVAGLLAIGALWVLVRLLAAAIAFVQRCWMQLLAGGIAKTIPRRDVGRNIGGTYVYQPYLPESDDLITQLCRESKWLLVSQDHDCYVVRSGDPAAQRSISTSAGSRATATFGFGAGFLFAFLWKRKPRAERPIDDA